jgi:hypothetical protein
MRFDMIGIDYVAAENAVRRVFWTLSPMPTGVFPAECKWAAHANESEAVKMHRGRNECSALLCAWPWRLKREEKEQFG